MKPKARKQEMNTAGQFTQQHPLQPTASTEVTARQTLSGSDSGPETLELPALQGGIIPGSREARACYGYHSKEPHLS